MKIYVLVILCLMFLKSLIQISKSENEKEQVNAVISFFTTALAIIFQSINL